MNAKNISRTMQTNGKFAFTVEQIEIVRRLRNSGLTKEQVVTAFESFGQIDDEIGAASLNVPVTLQALQAQALQHLALTVPTAIGMGTNILQLQDNRLQQKMQQLSQQRQKAQLQLQFSHKLSQQIEQHCKPTVFRQQQQQQQQGDDTSQTAVSDSGVVTDSSCTSEDFSSRTMDEEDGEIDSDEFKDFISQGEINCCEEIKAFVLQHNVKQQQIGILAGVSQPHVSRYLRADFNSMSERTSKAIKKWYLLYRKNPTTIGPSANAALMGSNGACGSPPAPTIGKVKSRNSSFDLAAALTTGTAAASEVDLVSFPRRERFVFRPNHLQILEKYFADDNYPSYDKREEMTTVCNKTTEEIVGRDLTNREKVSVQIVSNWFANKRKDLKKLCKEEGHDESQIIVPTKSRGRPTSSRAFLLDTSTALLLQSILDRRQNPQTTAAAKFPSCANGNRSSEQIDDDEKSSAATACSADLLGASPMDEETEMLQRSVEMAAVNQAIMSLTGQKPIDVKTEKADLSEYTTTNVDAAAACRPLLSTPPPPLPPTPCIAAELS